MYGIIPPYLLRAIIKNGSTRQQALAWTALLDTEQRRGERILMASLGTILAVPAGAKRRTIYDARHLQLLPGKLVRGEGDPKSADDAVNEAYDGSGATYDFYAKLFDRNSIDNRGLRLDSSVHYGRDYDNAFWNGKQMVYGDGDGQIFGRFTGSIDVIGHELTHGVTQYEANLLYRDQPGALNESISDVFGSLLKQYKKNQTADQADWLIGQGLFLPGVSAQAIRSMKAPGTAYDDPVLGKDPQPAHMRDYVNTADDNGGVHINSGIPNKAFYEAAVRLGGYAWEKAGRIWYRALCDKLRPLSNFSDAARLTGQAARELFGARSAEERTVAAAWASVGI